MGKFTFTQTEIPGVVVIEPQVFGDDRGYFMETYQKDQFAEAGIDKEFVQDNQSRSTRGVLRGLHFQKNHFSKNSNFWEAKDSCSLSLALVLCSQPQSGHCTG